VILVAFFNKLVVEQGCYRQRCESFSCSFVVWVNLIEVNLREIAVEVSAYDLTKGLERIELNDALALQNHIRVMLSIHF